MKKIQAAAAALLIAAFVLCGCSASGRVSTAKDGIIRDEQQDARTADEGLIDDMTEKDTVRDSRKDANGNVPSAGSASTGR